MEPSYLDARTDSTIAMRHLLFAGSIVVANAENGVSESEINAFEQFFDKGDYNEKLNPERIREELPQRMQRVRDNCTEPQAMQVVRDLCIIAMADGDVSTAERDVLNEIADGLGISRTFICQTIECEIEPD